MPQGICRLCLKEADLSNSHILPEFFYLSLYDETHRTMSVSSNKKEKFIQKGIREHLLCQNCETKLSKYEGYAVKVIRDISNFEKETHNRFIFSDTVDYTLFKLFQLSILWRGAISTHQMFNSVDLGRHEEKIRSMLNEGNPGLSTDYGCFIFKIHEPQKIHRIIMPPKLEKLFGHNGCRFMTGELFWYFVLSRHRIQESVKTMFLQENGLLRIWTAPWSEEEVYANIKKLMLSRKVE